MCLETVLVKIKMLVEPPECFQDTTFSKDVNKMWPFATSVVIISPPCLLNAWGWAKLLDWDSMSVDTLKAAKKLIFY